MKKPALFIYELHHLGDMVMALPFLKGATDHYKVEVLCHNSVGRFLSWALPEAEVICSGSSWSDTFKRYRSLTRDRKPDISLCAWPDPRAHLLMAYSAAPQRISFALQDHNFIASDVSWRKKRMKAGKSAVRFAELLLRRPACTQLLDKHDSRQHHIEDWNQLGELLGVSLDFQTPWLPVPELPQELRTLPSPSWVIHPGARLPTKRWSLQGYTELLKKWADTTNPHVWVIQPPGEDVPETYGDEQRIVHTPSIQELASVLHAADHVLANDSFAGHLAAALGTPVTSIFGSGHPDWFRPWGNQHTVIRSSACPHHPCLDRCVMPSPICLETIQPQKVWNEVSSHGT